MGANVPQQRLRKGEGLLAARGEAVDPIAVGVPVSMRRSTTAATLGNQVAPILVPVPVTGAITQRPEQVPAAGRRRPAAAAQPPTAGIATAHTWHPQP